MKKYRFTPEQIEILLRVRWWEWDNETIDKNAEFLIYPDKFFEKFGEVQGQGDWYVSSQYRFRN
ncbi:hypothetical protein FACS1894167_05380 [Synergistales bacterium]|nr:hypothetical protein FACS1894167_05380 [Synergistales bacterium]